jgi:ergothioneine biosynthesis protein EgtB
MTTLSPAPADAPHAPAADGLAQRFNAVRAATLAICEPLVVEDFCIQTCEDVSPTKWHLAHTTWFFERFVLKAFHPDHAEFHPRYDFLFNSYYNTVGPMHCRPARGRLSRPTVDDILDYRRTIDDAVRRLIDDIDRLAPDRRDAFDAVVTLGLHHEQQHQELMVTDLKHVFSANPLLPTYRPRPQPGPLPATHPPAVSELAWVGHDGGLHAIGRDADGFCFDNETPAHRRWLEPFELADRTVTNREFLAFLDDDGYGRHELWLSLGWATVTDRGWRHPLYWYRQDDAWMEFTLHGPTPLNLDEPVSHLSYFEADAYARWAGARLPTEAEWEVACRDLASDDGSAPDGHFAEARDFHPRPATGPSAPSPQPRLLQTLGTLWEWTASPYTPYPGYTPLPGALGEYNGKFMCNQFVLRGGSVATPATHLRTTYRNFFDPAARWQFTGLRLAR